MIQSDTAFFERQTSLINEIGTTIVELTPEHWREAVLEVEVELRPGGIQGMVHAITSPEGHREPVTPDDTLFELTRRLYLLFSDYEQPWKNASFRVYQTGEDTWKFKVKYSYASHSVS